MSMWSGSVADQDILFATLEFGRSAGYARALFGIKASNIYLLNADMSREWHKGYRAGLIEGGKELERKSENRPKRHRAS